MKPASVRCLLWLCLLAGIFGCERKPDVAVPSPGVGADSNPAPTPPHEPTWLIVDENALRELPDRQIYWQGPQPPQVIRKTPVRVAVTPENVPRGVWIAYLAVSERGTVLKARILASPPGVAIEGPLVESLKVWRFDPAKLNGRPVAVYVTQTFELEGSQSRPQI